MDDGPAKALAITVNVSWKYNYYIKYVGKELLYQKINFTQKQYKIGSHLSTQW